MDDIQTDITDTLGRVLIIAGSDSGGGAGIQADIKTCAAFGAYSATAVTAITAQNTQGVQDIMLMTPDMVRAQIQSVLSDIGADIIKIGMLGSAEIIEVVAEEIESADAFIVLDPVMVATSGAPLLDADGIKALKTRLLPGVDVVTPNVPEAALLTAIDITDIDDLVKAGDQLVEAGVFAALMKGGHLDGNTVVDVLVSQEGASVMSGPRLRSRHTHGTGCTLASAVAANLALGVSLDAAVNTAREFVFEAIRTAPGFGKGAGPLNHGLTHIGAEVGGDADKPDPAHPFAALKDLGG